jgi:D-sedoheptulose 7-phosphate isomerase
VSKFTFGGTMLSEITRWLEESAGIVNDTAKSQAAAIEKITRHIVAAYKKGGKVVLCGNGGSAADAQHLAAELVGRFMMNRPALPAIALTTNTSILTAIGNDYSYDEVFKRQVEAWVTVNDVVIGISTSGNSPNIIAALKAAKAKGAVTIGFTGGSGGQLAKAADVALIVPSSVTPHIQEAHITIGHIIFILVEKEIFGAANAT